LTELDTSKKYPFVAAFYCKRVLDLNVILSCTMVS